MKQFFLILSLFFGCFFANTSFADPYVGIIGGGTAGYDLQHSRLDTSTGYYIGGRIGFSSLCSFLRLEEEISYQRSAIHSISKRGFHLKHVEGHVSFWSFMTNLLVDLDCPFIVSPYLGGGIGYARGSGEGKGRFGFESAHAKEKIDRNAFAWQALIGLKYCVCFGLEAAIEYRYFKINDVDANHKFGLALTKFF